MNRFFIWIRTHLLKQIGELGLVLGVVFVVIMMIIPMPTILLDLFMTLNLLLSIVIILNVLYIRSALEFSSFPSILLITTVFSLALNVSSTRLILAKGENFDGKIIRAFGNFVVGSSGLEGLVIGIIIFAIIIAVQFIVITKGATRVAEVSARFTLDALPGKQMAIEAEFNSGAITEEELVMKRREMQREVDFYGAMDGASKFVSGNVKAGILITLINIVGGIIVGVIIRGENIGTAALNYIQLTIGDGLVSQFPALFISTASGIIVTRSVSDDDISKELRRELGLYTKIYYVAGGLFCILAFLPGFPWYILFPLGLLLVIEAVRSDKKKLHIAEQTAAICSDQHAEATQVDSPKLEPLDPISLEIGYDLVPLVQDDSGKAELLNRISSIRREIGVKLGVVIPLMRIVDNYLLDSTVYSVKLNGVEIGSGNIKINKLLAIHANGVQDTSIEGDNTHDPAFGLPALWIFPTERAKAEHAGYTVADPTSVISTHISTLLEQHASELVSRQDISNMLKQFETKYPAIVEDVRQHLGIGQIQRVLQRLLEERVSVRNLVAIFETLSDYGAMTKDVDFLVEKVRQALARQISGQYMDEHKKIYVYSLPLKIEKVLIDTHRSEGQGLTPTLRNDLLYALSQKMKLVKIEHDSENGKEYVVRSPVLITSESARPVVYKLLASSLNNKQYAIPILSTLDVAHDCIVQTLGTLEITEEHTDE